MALGVTGLLSRIKLLFPDGMQHVLGADMVSEGLLQRLGTKVLIITLLKLTFNVHIHQGLAGITYVSHS